MLSGLVAGAVAGVDRLPVPVNRLWTDRTACLPPNAIVRPQGTPRGRPCNSTDGKAGARIKALGVHNVIHFRVEWWDTYQGRLSKTEQVVSSSNVLPMTLPPFARDSVCTLRCE